METLFFSRQLMHTGGGVWLYSFIGKESKIPMLFGDESACCTLLDNGKIIDAFEDSLTSEEYDQAWGYKNYIELWKFNSNYPKDVIINKAVMRFIGFSENEIAEFELVIQWEVDNDFSGFRY